MYILLAHRSYLIFSTNLVNIKNFKIAFFQHHPWKIGKKKSSNELISTLIAS